MIRSDRGALVLEVNSSPGLEGVETATGKNVAGRIISYLEKQHEMKFAKRNGAASKSVTA